MGRVSLTEGEEEDDDEKGRWWRRAWGSRRVGRFVRKEGEEERERRSLWLWKKQWQPWKKVLEAAAAIVFPLSALCVLGIVLFFGLRLFELDTVEFRFNDFIKGN